MTPEQMAAIFPACPEPAAWALSITKAWLQFGFDNVNAQAGFCGITGNETGGYTSVKRENMNYSAQRAMEVFGSSRATPCVQYCDDGDNGKNFASCIYAGMIGNGPYETGDGWAFRGGGIIQMTGRANYTACGDGLGIPLEENPDAIANNPDVSAASAAWFMAVYNPKILPLLSTGSEADFLTAAGMVGYPPPGATETRLAYRAKALEVLAETTPHEVSHPPPATESENAPDLSTAPRTLQIGDIGDDVKALQQALNALADAMLDEDGVFGSTTMLAVRHYQRNHGLVQDGIVGPQTRKSLAIWKD